MGLCRTVSEINSDFGQKRNYPNVLALTEFYSAGWLEN